MTPKLALPVAPVLALCLAATVCLAGDTPSRADSLTDLAPGHALLAPVSRIADDRLDECSGMVFDGRHYWAHNDSGDSARLFRSTSPDFTKAEAFDLVGADAVDWEELTLWDGDLLVCDIGDNRRRRDDLMLYRAHFVTPRDSAGVLELKAAYPVAYPDGRHDAEAALVLDGKPHIVTKARGGGPSNVYRFDKLKTAAELGRGKRNVGEHVGTLELEAGVQITGATMHSSGVVVLLSYTHILQYAAKKLDGKPLKQTLIAARQCEALCFAGDRLIFCNEQREVFAVDNFLKRDYVSMLPPRASAEVPRVSQSYAPDGTGNAWVKDALGLPMQNLRKDEHLRWVWAGDAMLFKGRFNYDGTFQSTRTAVAAVGSAVYFTFGQTPRLSPTDHEAIFVLGDDGDGAPKLWRVRLEGTASLTPVKDAVVKGKAASGVFEFEFSLPASEVFGKDPPRKFLFNAFGRNLRNGEVEPRFSGVDDFAARLPYLWGDVTVKS